MTQQQVHLLSLILCTTQETIFACSKFYLATIVSSNALMIRWYNYLNEFDKILMNSASFSRREKRISRIFVHKDLTKSKTCENSFTSFLNSSTLITYILLRAIFLKLLVYYLFNMLSFDRSIAKHSNSLF